MDHRELAFKLMRIDQLKKWHQGMKIKKHTDLQATQFPILHYICEHEQCTQQDIANHFAISRAAAAKSTKRLFNSAYITKINDENDSRKNMLSATEKGKEVIGLTHDIFVEVDNLSLKGFSSEEINQLNDYLTRIMENLETDYSRNKGPIQLFNSINKEDM